MKNKPNLLKQWKKHDPLLSDLDGFQRFSDAHELKRLMRLGHPDEHGESWSRGQVIKAISEQGLQILKDLRWPTEMDSKYINRYTRQVTTLRDTLDTDDQLNSFRTEMHDLEEKLNELTKGEFYGWCAARGLETFNLVEIRKLAKKHDSLQFKVTLRRAVLLHKGFYEQLHHCLLTDDSVKSMSSPQNILKQSRWLGIDVDTMTPLEVLPPKKWTWFWSVVEHWEPASEEEQAWTF